MHLFAVNYTNQSWLNGRLLDLAFCPFKARAPYCRAKISTCCLSLLPIFFCDFLSLFSGADPSSFFGGALTTGWRWCSRWVVSEILAGLDHNREWVAWVQRSLISTAWLEGSTPGSPTPPMPSSPAGQPRWRCFPPSRLLSSHAIFLWFLAIRALHHVSHLPLACSWTPFIGYLS